MKFFCFGKAKEHEAEYSQLFGCDVGKFPFRYLGLPMHYRKLSNSDWKTIEQRIEKKLSSWKAKMLTVGGRLVLNNSGFVELTYVHVVFSLKYQKGC